MDILLVSLREMTGHFAIWCFVLILLWVGSHKTKRMDRAWIVSWERKHNAPIGNHKRSIAKILTVVKILRWGAGIVMVAGFAVIWSKVSSLPAWVTKEAVKAVVILLFTFIVLVVVDKLQKKRINKIDELELMVKQRASAQ